MGTAGCRLEPQVTIARVTQRLGKINLGRPSSAIGKMNTRSDQAFSQALEVWLQLSNVLLAKLVDSLT